jgi:hypothetical protein
VTKRTLSGPGGLTPVRRSFTRRRKASGYHCCLVAGLAAVMWTGVLTQPILAHHSFAMYDQSTTKTLTGKLVRYIPGANHAQLIFDVLDADGKPVMQNGKAVQWGVETGSAAALARQGVAPKTFPEGTIFTVTLYPLRDGRTFGAMAGLLIKCGNAMPKGGCTKATGEVLISGDNNPA